MGGPWAEKYIVAEEQGGADLKYYILLWSRQYSTLPHVVQVDSAQTPSSPSKVLAVRVESKDSPSSVWVLVKFWP